jgi:signal transduction histidine kinase
VNFIRRHPRAVDVALALALCALVLLEVLGSDQDVPLNLAIPVALAMTLPFAWRRQYPVVVAMIVLVAFAAQGAAGDWDLEPQTELLAAALAFWVLGTSVSTPRSWYAGAAGFVLLVIHEPGDVIVMGPLMVGVFAAGRLMRSRSEIAKALERDRGEAERRAVLEERARISRELHDVVAHAISLMTVQAGAERLALGNERPQTSEALEQIEITGRQTLAEMRRLLGKLRDPEAAVDLAPQPAGRAGDPRRTSGCSRCRGHAGSHVARCGYLCLPDRPGGPDQRTQTRQSAARNRSRAVRR